MLFYLLVGIVLGVTFHEFWRNLYFKTLVQVRSWLDRH